MAQVVRSHFNPDAERATSLQKRIVVIAIGTEWMKQSSGSFHSTKAAGAVSIADLNSLRGIEWRENKLPSRNRPYKASTVAGKKSIRARGGNRQKPMTGWRPHHEAWRKEAPSCSATMAGWPSSF